MEDNCQFARIWAINSVVNTATQQINSLSATSGALIMGILTSPFTSAACPNDVGFTINSVVGQTNSLIDQIAQNAVSDPTFISGWDCRE